MGMDYRQAAAEFMRLLPKIKGGGMDKLHRHMKGEGFVLHVLAHMDGAALPGQLCDATHTSSARVAATLGSLEQKGYVTREIDSADRRRVLVRLTDEGRHAWEDMHDAMRCQLAELLRALGEDDTQELLRLIARLAEIHKSMNDAEEPA